MCRFHLLADVLGDRARIAYGSIYHPIHCILSRVDPERVPGQGGAGRGGAALRGPVAAAEGAVRRGGNQALLPQAPHFRAAGTISLFCKLSCRALV